MRALLRQLLPAAVILALFTLICGVVYPLVVTGIGQTAFKHRANGSVVTVNNQAVGSTLIGQIFTDPKYFHARPSAAGKDGYDSMSSSGSNLGPNNPDFLKSVEDRVAAYRTENNLPPETMVPVDAVTASGSGLDPSISVANARLQAPRVAQARGMDVAVILTAINAHTDGRPLGILGDPAVSVLTLNVDLDGVK
jgi:potassium-transporting ATPase KdpC subunit